MKRKRNTEVTVNIGGNGVRQEGGVQPMRLKYLMVKVWPEYNKWQLLSEAVKKHTNHDISFTLLSNEWTRSLIYPDGMEVPGKDHVLCISIPGKDDVYCLL